MRIEGTTIDDAWRNAITACFKYGVDYEVKGGGLHLYSQYWDIVKEMVY